MLSEMHKFKVYLKLRLQYFDQTNGQNPHGDLAYSELMHIFSEIFPKLEKEHYENIRNS